MNGKICIHINGEKQWVDKGITLAAALYNLGTLPSRNSRGGEPRMPFCGMAVCFECSLRVGDTNDVLACNTLCLEGMEVYT